MNKRISQIIGIFILSLSLFSCEKEPVFPGKQVSPALQKALVELGYTFKDNKLLVNDKVIQTSSLNLAGKGITGLDGLEVFPALRELTLDNNKLEKLGKEELKAVEKLPLTKISLRNCGIRELDIASLTNLEELCLDGSNTFGHIRGLSRSTHTLLKTLDLPASVKWNLDEILAFYNNKTDKTVMRIEAGGKLVDYTSSRAVPDDVFRGFLKKKYPEVFTEKEEIDLNRTFDITADNKEEKTTWKTGMFDPLFFDATGIKDLEGLQFFKNRVIRTWHIYNAEFEAIDLSNDSILESFRIGSDRAGEFEINVTVNPNIKKLRIANCKNLRDLTFEGGISEIDLDGNTSLENLSFGKAVKTLDLSGCPAIMRVSVMNPLFNPDSEPGELTKIVFPVSDSWKGARTLDLSNTLIADIDFSKLKADDFFGVVIALEKCPNLKTVKVALRLGNASTFSKGHFEEIDLRGSTMWNVAEQKWLSAENIRSLYQDNPKLKTLNGKPHVPEEEYPDHVKTLVVNTSNFLQWTYLHFDENGELKIRDVDTYPSADPATTGKDAEWRERNDWDFALHYKDLRTNGGESGKARGGIHDTGQGSFEGLTVEKCAAFEYKEDARGNLNMILSLDQMPPPRASVSMSKLPIFIQTGMPPRFDPTGKILVLRKADGKYALLKFTGFYGTDKTAAMIEIKYTVLK